MFFHMKTIKALWYSALACLLMLPVSQSFGQGRGDSPDDGWQFMLAPYLLMGSVSGDATVGVAGPAEVDMNFGDILEKLQFAFMAHGEVFKGNWGLIADYAYLKLGDDITTQQIGVVDITQKQTILETFISRRFRQQWGWFDVYGGIRYWDNSLDLELEGFEITRLSFGENWVDPVIGGRVIYNFSDRFTGNFRGDIGGFGVGSDFSYNLQPGVGYHFSDWFTLMLQYKYLYTNYSNDKEGLDFFDYKASTHGPLLGVLFRF